MHNPVATGMLALDIGIAFSQSIADVGQQRRDRAAAAAEAAGVQRLVRVIDALRAENEALRADRDRQVHRACRAENALIALAPDIKKGRR